MGRLRRLAPYALIILGVLLAYGHSFSNQFLFDDEFLILKNSYLRSWSSFLEIFRSSSTMGSGGIDSFYRPLQTLAYLIVFQTFGLSTFGFHLLNVGLHGANSCLVYVLGRKLNFERVSAALVGLLWALHPVHTEAVTYMSATADVLYTFFCLLACLSLLPDFTSRRVALASIFFFLGLLSKESAIVFPALAVALRFYLVPAEERFSLRPYFFTLPLWFLAAGYLLARKTILNFDDTFHFYKQANIYTENFVVRFQTFLATLPAYARLLIWPTDLHMERRFPVFVSPSTRPVLAGLFLALLMVSTIVSARRGKRRALAFGFLFFAAAHVPHTGVLVPVNALFLEHWMYLPSLGLAFALMSWNSRIFRGFVLTSAVICGILTFRQNEVWATPISFYEHILRYNPEAARVHNNLAMAYSDGGRVSEAISHYEQAIVLSDAYPQTHHNLALLLLGQKREAEALRHFERALELDPNFYHTYAKLYEYYSARGDTARAQENFRKYEEARKRMGF